MIGLGHQYGRRDVMWKRSIHQQSEDEDSSFLANCWKCLVAERVEARVKTANTKMIQIVS